MKYLYFILLFFSTIFAQEAALENAETVSSIASMAPSVISSEQKDVIVIDPNQRAQDFAQAYEIIKRGKSPQTVFFHTSDGRTISNVVEMTPMNNGTLVLFKVMTNMGTKYELIPIENLASISQL